MTATNVVSLNFKSEEAMEEFLEMYERDSPKLFPDAEMLMMIKTIRVIVISRETIKI